MNDIKEIYDFLKKCETYYLATADGDQPRVRPFGTVDIFNGSLYIQTGKVKNVSAQMKKNPKVELCGMSEGKWLRVEARAVLDESMEAQEHMLKQYPSLQSMYKAGDGNTEVFRLESGKAQFCSFTEPPRTVEF